MHKLCPFCHTWCSSNIFDAHVASHTQKLPDGQMQDHVTVRPEQRFAGDIAKEPRWYVHPRCGGVTGMPEEIIRSYMVDPFLYNESSFCTGCHNYVPTAELYWQETNESLQAASYRRKAEFIQKNGLNPQDFVWDALGPARRKSRGGSGVGTIALVALGGLAALFLVGFVVMFAVIAARSQAARRQPAPAPFNAGFPRMGRDFQPVKFPDIPEPNFPKGPDIDKLMRESHEQMEQHLKESQQRQEEFMERLRSDAFGPPGGLPTPPNVGPPAGFSGIEEARKRAEESRQRSRERMDALRERTRSRP